ncbi:MULTISPECIES: hypothetical protein [Paenibacillus]|uniref:hypothetical protein n=1 Tax=Paenibacillus TaxID=44249 RepID=UPI00222166A4|nr:hypothetical protein [Paenibacillus polymyxa]
MEYGWSLPRRITHLNELRQTDDKDNPQFQLFFQNRRQFFTIYTVPIGLPKYRLANGRTQASQESYLSKNPDLPQDYFERDEENVSVQEVQHTLLKGLLGSGGKNIIKFFKNNRQNEPLILTHTGFVVNGNRRLCALRELLEEDEVKYSYFSHIDLIILPPCEEKDIDELEAQLQVVTDIKADYNWISEACMLRNRHIKHRYSLESLAQIYDKTVPQIEDILDTLHHVDMYLDSQNKSKRYEEVVKQEYAFKQLKKARKKIKNDAKRTIFTTIAYTMLSAPPETGRLWDSIPEAEENLEKIIANLQDELEIDVELKGDDSYSLLDDEEDELESLIVSVSESRNKERILEVVDDVIREQREIERESRNKKYVLIQVNKANTFLKNAINGVSRDTESSGIDQQLDEILISVSKLRELLRKNVTH